MSKYSDAIKVVRCWGRVEYSYYGYLYWEDNKFAYLRGDSNEYQFDKKTISSVKFGKEEFFYAFGKFYSVDDFAAFA